MPLKTTSEGGSEITQLLERIREGDRECESRLVAAVYGELHRIARTRLAGERRGHTLQPSALVNEAYIRMMAGKPSWQNRAHFFTVAAGVMRNVLVDHARARNAKRRAGGRRVDLDLAGGVASGQSDQILALDLALQELSVLNARHASVVEMHFFGGLTFEEIGTALRISARTAKRDWDLARAWLEVRLRGNVDDSG